MLSNKSSNDVQLAKRSMRVYRIGQPPRPHGIHIILDGLDPTTDLEIHLGTT